MGAALTCCKARAGPHDLEEVRREPLGRQCGAGVNPCPAATDAATATAAATILSDGGGASPRSLLHRASPDFFSVVDGYGSDAEEEWHDALSEADLAEVGARPTGVLCRSQRCRFEPSADGVLPIPHCCCRAQPGARSLHSWVTCSVGTADLKAPTRKRVCSPASAAGAAPP